MENNTGQKNEIAVWQTGSEGIYWIQIAHNNIQSCFLQKIFRVLKHLLFPLAPRFTTTSIEASLPRY